MEKVTYEMLDKANQAIRKMPIHGKDYAEVNQRVKAFRMVYPQGTIVTELLSNVNGVAVMKATVMDEDGRVLANGTAYEKENSSYINKTSYIENLETSCIGRALGFAGFGIDVSIASYEEVDNAIQQQNADSNKKEEKYQRRKTIVDEQGREKSVILCTLQQIEILNDLFKDDKDKLAKILNDKNLENLQDMPKSMAEELIMRCMKKKESKTNE